MIYALLMERTFFLKYHKAIYAKVVPLMLVVASLLIEGCSPSSQQKTEMVQCSSGLKIVLLDIYLSSDATSPTNSLQRVLAASKTCPVTGAVYKVNPDLGKWIASSNYGSEIAIFCPDPHYKTFGKTRYAAITFDGALLKLTNAPNWSEQWP